MSGKTIQLNPAFLSMSKRGGGKNQTLKNKSNHGKKEKPTMHNSTNKIKKKLIEKVKTFQNKTIEEEKRKKNEELNNNDNANANANDIKTETEFNKSMNFLEDLAKKRKEKQIHKKQIHKQQNQQPHQVMQLVQDRVIMHRL